MTDVKCNVSSCHYWGSGNICKANSILVDHDQKRSDTTRMESSSLDFDSDNLFFESQRSRSSRRLDASKESSRLESGMLGDTISTSEATCCRTFRPKGSPKLS